MAKHRRSPATARGPALAAALRGGAIIVAVVVCMLAGAKLMSFAAGPSDSGRAAAVGRAQSDPHQPPARRPPAAKPAALPHVAGRSVTAVGDSLMVAATPALDQALPGIYIDAEVGRQFSTGLQVIARLKAQGLLRPIVVIGLGTNGSVTSGEIAVLFAEIGPHRRLVLVNTFEDRPWEQEVNSTLAGATASHPATVVLANWFNAVRGRTYLLWPDGIHPQPAGGVVYARLVRSAVEKVSGLPG